MVVILRNNSHLRSLDEADEQKGRLRGGAVCAEVADQRACTEHAQSGWAEIRQVHSCP